LSDDARPAIGPSTIYLFLLVGALYNVVLAEEGVARWRWLELYLGVAAALWSSGMAQAEECLDPEAHRRRVVRLGDAAVLVLLGEELIRRGCLQRSLQEHWARRRGARVAAAVATVVVTGLLPAGLALPALIEQAAASLVWAATARRKPAGEAGFESGRVLASFLARAVAEYLSLLLTLRALTGH